MFLGHFGVGLAAKAAAPRTSLGSLFFAAQFADLLWPTLLLLGIERVEIEPGVTAVTPLNFAHYPVSHSLAAMAGWGVLTGLGYLLARRYPRGALVMALAVVSHWFLDLLVHRPDLPLIPGGTLYGLGIWSSLPGTLLAEFLIFGAGVALYLRTTRPSDRAGIYCLWGLVVFLVAIFFGNLFGPPPPSVNAIAWVGQAQWLLVAWGFWVDRHRRTFPR